MMTANPVALFDFDGTICDDFDESIRILNLLSDEFGYRKIEMTRLGEMKELTMRALLATLGIPLHKAPFIARKGSVLLQEKMRDLPAVAGILEAIRELSGRGVALGMVTSNSEANVRAFLDHHGLDQFKYFSTGSSLFGKARLIKRLLKAHELQGRPVFYIGDETRDIDAAKSARVKIIAVSWGFNSKRALEAKNPDFLIDHPSELAAIIGTDLPKNLAY